MPGIAAVGMNTAARMSAIATSRSSHLFHCAKRCVSGRKTQANMMFNRFDNDNGVIHDQTDREYEAEQ